MAKKKKSRKSTRRARQARQQARPRPSQAQVQEQAVANVAAAVAEKPKSVKRKGTAALTDFAKEYSYVYYDLRKMFLLAAAMFVLLIVVNVVLTYLLIA